MSKSPHISSSHTLEIQHFAANRTSHVAFMSCRTMRATPFNISHIFSRCNHRPVDLIEVVTHLVILILQVQQGTRFKVQALLI